jgi:hypothetical protein
LSVAAGFAFSQRTRTNTATQVSALKHGQSDDDAIEWRSDRASTEGAQSRSRRVSRSIRGSEFPDQRACWTSWLEVALMAPASPREAGRVRLTKNL